MNTLAVCSSAIAVASILLFTVRAFTPAPRYRHGGGGDVLDDNDIVADLDQLAMRLDSADEEVWKVRARMETDLDPKRHDASLKEALDRFTLIRREYEAAACQNELDLQ